MRVFITGLTGTLGTSLAELHHRRGDQVWGCSRSEAGAVRWLRDHGREATLYVTCASELAERCTDLARLLPTMERLYHCAAMKHVELCEAQPEEAKWQNVVLTSLVAGACKDAGVPLVFAGTDKACLPSGVYGATKLLAERIVTRLGGSVVRLGNLVGSSGSVFAKWREQASRGEPISLTDPEMTRFFLSVKEAARFMMLCHLPGRVVAPRMKAARMGDVAEAIGAEVRITGARPGETRHQWLVGPDETVSVEEDRFVIGCPRQEGGEWSGAGLHSNIAERWGAAEFLKMAWEGES